MSCIHFLRGFPARSPPGLVVTVIQSCHGPCRIAIVITCTLTSLWLLASMVCTA